MNEIQFKALEPQLEIGKVIIEAMIEQSFKKGIDKTIIPATFEDKEFEIEVRLIQ